MPNLTQDAGAGVIGIASPSHILYLAIFITPLLAATKP